MTLRPKIRLVVLAAASVVLLAEIVHFLADQPDRFREVYGGAVQVAYPEHSLILGEAAVGPISTHLEFTADRYGESNSEAFRGAVNVNALRYLSLSSPARTEMTDMLRSFGGGTGADNNLKAQARRELMNLPEGVFATAIVELTVPMAERELSQTFAGDVDTKLDNSFLFLSGLEPGMDKPIFWRPCAVYSAAECERTSSLELYRRWVSRFSWLDGIGLAQLGLDVRRLREAGREGRVYGLLTSGYPPRRLLEMMSSTSVRTIRVVDTWTMG